MGNRRTRGLPAKILLAMPALFGTVGCTELEVNPATGQLTLTRFWSDVTATLSKSCSANGAARLPQSPPEFPICDTTITYGSNAGDAAIAAAVAGLVTLAGKAAVP